VHVENGSQERVRAAAILPFAGDLSFKIDT
jgi:hypothetical protein